MTFDDWFKNYSKTYQKHAWKLRDAWDAALLSKERDIVALHFKMVIDDASSIGHQRYRTEGMINTGLEAHLKTCRECRETIARDLIDFAKQIQVMTK